MTRASLREYAAVQRERYLRAPRGTPLLTRWCLSLGSSQAAYLYVGAPRPATSCPRSGRPRRTAPPWPPRPSCSPRPPATSARTVLPFLPELLDRLTRSGDVGVTPEVDKDLRQVSPATLARLSAPFRRTLPHRGLTTTRPGASLKHQIPVRTFAECTDAQPGFLELHLLAYCGATTQSFYLYTLCAVDVATTWCTSKPSGQGPEAVCTAIHHVRQRLPMPLRGLDSDNAPSSSTTTCMPGASARHHLHPQSPVPEERQCPCRAEERAIVRPLIGYIATLQSRVASRARYTSPACTSTSSSPSSSSFLSSAAPARASRVLSRPHPLSALLATRALSTLRPQELQTVYQRLNPLQLRLQLETALERLCTLAVPP